MSDVIAEFVAALTFKADLTPLTEAEKKAKETAAASAAAWGKLGGVIAGVGKAALGAAGGLLALVERSAASAAGIDDMAKQLSVGTTELQRLSFAATKAGGGPESLGSAIKFLNKNLDEARSGTGPAADAFRSLGISMSQLEGKDVETQMGVLADAFTKIEDPAKRTNAALALLGRGGLELLPAFEDGAAGLRAMGDEAVRLGQVLDEDAITKGAELDSQIEDLKLSALGFARELGVSLIPAVQSLMKHWEDLVPIVASLGVAFVGLKLGAVAQGLTSMGAAAVGAQVGVAGLVAVVGALSFGLASALDNALGLSDAIAGVENTSGKRGAGGFVGDIDAGERIALGMYERRARTLDEEIEGRKQLGYMTGSRERERDAVLAEIEKINARGRGRAQERQQVAIDADTEQRVGTAYEQIKAEKKREAALKHARAVGLRNSKPKKKGGRGGAKFSEDITAGEFEFDELHGDELRRLAERYGVGSAAVDASIKAGAAAVASGDTPFLARNAALGRLGSSAGVDLTVKRQTDPLLSQIFGDENVPDVQLSSIARGAEPQVLISNITNTFNFDIDQTIDGAGDPAMVGDMSGRAIRDFFQGSISQATRTAKVNFAR
jgi:hypothetical protein